LAHPQTTSDAFHDALAWPFFETRHRELGARIDAWASEHLSDTHADHANVDATCRRLVRELGAAGWLRYGVGGTAYGGHGDTIDTRAVCLLRETLANLEIDYSEFIFIDLGSGKGRALLLASEYPFQRIIGVELLPEFHRVALENVAKYRSANQKCFAIECYCADTEAYSFPRTPLVLYLFNPLPEMSLRRVIARLEESLREHPRPAYVLYLNPMLEHVLAESSLQRVSSSLQCAVYSDRRARK